MQNRGLLKYKLDHLLFWMLIAGIWFFLRYEDYSSPGRAMQVTIIKVLDIAFMIYITNFILIPKLLYRRKYILFALAFISIIITSSFIKLNILSRVQHFPELRDFSGHWKERINDFIIPHFFIVIAGAAVKLMIDNGRLQQRMAETAKEKAEAELNFLKSQINPHFIFNSLNSVYFLIDKTNVVARETLHKFSEMLRYQLYEMNSNRIAIEKELQYLRDYMDLQQLRKDENYLVQFNCSTEVKDFLIEPLLLIPFVENAFKHISHRNDKTNYVKVELYLTGNVFTFTAENSKENQQTTEIHGGIGLTNVKRRLELLYPGKHELKIEETENKFAVQLNLYLS